MMKGYRLRITERVTKDVAVAAESEEEAERIAANGDYTVIEEIDTELINVDSIEER